MNINRFGAVAVGVAAAAVLAGAAAAPVVAALPSDPVPVHQPSGSPVDGGPAVLNALGDPDDGGQFRTTLA